MKRLYTRLSIASKAIWWLLPLVRIRWAPVLADIFALSILFYFHLTSAPRFSSRDLGMHCFPMCGIIQFYPSDTICRRVPAPLLTVHTVREIGSHLLHPPPKLIAKIPAEGRVVSWGLPNIHNLRRETWCSVDSWMCDRLWFHYICTHGYSFRRFSDWNRRGTYGWTVLCPCCTVQVCSRIGLATWSKNLAQPTSVCEMAVPFCDICEEKWFEFLFWDLRS